MELCATPKAVLWTWLSFGAAQGNSDVSWYEYGGMNMGVVVFPTLYLAPTPGATSPTQKAGINNSSVPRVVPGEITISNEFNLKAIRRQNAG
ncbi:hypothetical protein F5Y05DRAFT_392524 [Hypoxylon sp. FL0543]|nr:hypothetical protein F5Y05DRAFT_392524 [Hypoxylon sp. FL0543]